MSLINALMVLVLLCLVMSGCGGSSENSPSSERPENDWHEESPSVPNEPVARSVHDALYPQQWSLHYDREFYTANNIHPAAHIHGGDYLDIYRGAGIRIAIIDDGLDMAHEDLTGALVASYDVTSRSVDVTYPHSYAIHGTAVTGLIAARQNDIGIKGLASDSAVIFLKYAEAMSDSQTIELFNKALEFGADVINCSWGTGYASPAVEDKIRQLATSGRQGRGIPIIFAVSNRGKSISPTDESAIAEVIAVGATDENNQYAAYSSYGASLDLVAPGGGAIGMTTLDLTGRRGYDPGDYLLYNNSLFFRGSSAAAPIVTGAVALLLQTNPALTRAELVGILRQTADKIGDIPYVDGRNDYYGYGKLNLAAAIDLALQKVE